jgi:hypothetical protein
MTPHARPATVAWCPDCKRPYYSTPRRHRSIMHRTQPIASPWVRRAIAGTLPASIR